MGCALLTRLRDAGLSVSRNGDHLIVTPRARLTDELRETIRQQKAELLASVVTVLDEARSQRASVADPLADFGAALRSGIAAVPSVPSLHQTDSGRRRQSGSAGRWMVRSISGGDSSHYAVLLRRLFTSFAPRPGTKMSKASKRQGPKMTSAASAATTDERTARLHAKQNKGESVADTLARYTLLPEVQAGITIKNFERGPMAGASLDQLVERLAEQSALSNKGDLSRAESLLTAQAHTLDAIFHDLARRAARNAGQYMEACDMYLRLALRAQSQCRATIETLAEIKNPSHVAFVKQANIANGPQQVNNGVPARGENQIPPIKLLEQTNGERLDFGAQGQAIGSHSAMETVGAVHRTEDDCGQG